MNTSESVASRFNHLMAKMAQAAHAAGKDIQMPPNFVATLGMQVTAFEVGTSLTAEFPFDARYANPLGLYLGGMTCALIDAVMGPLSYMAAQAPALTTEFSISYMRPFSQKDEKIIIEAVVISRSRQLVVMEATAHNPQGKLIAKARSTSLIPS